MNRRDFIGSVIGTIVSTELPFIANHANFQYRNHRLALAEAKLRIFQIPQPSLFRYRIYLIDENGIKFWMPNLTDVNRDMENLTCIFETSEMKLTRPLNIVKSGVVDNYNLLVGEKDIQRNYQFGDKINANYQITVCF